MLTAIQDGPVAMMQSVMRLEQYQKDAHLEHGEKKHQKGYGQQKKRLADTLHFSLEPLGKKAIFGLDNNNTIIVKEHQHLMRLM